MHISVWYCCLHPIESIFFQTCCNAFVSSLGTGFPREFYDAYWAIATPGDTARADAFNNAYFLSFGDFVPEGLEDAVPWVFFNDALFWAASALWVLNPLNQCQEGCSLISYLVPQD